MPAEVSRPIELDTPGREDRTLTPGVAHTMAPIVLGYARPDHGRAADAELLARAAQRIRLARSPAGRALLALADFLDLEADAATACPGAMCTPECDCGVDDPVDCAWWPEDHPCTLLRDPRTAVSTDDHHHCPYCFPRDHYDPPALVLAAAVLEDGAL